MKLGRWRLESSGRVVAIEARPRGAEGPTRDEISVSFRGGDGHGLRPVWYPSPQHQALDDDEVDEFEGTVLPRALTCLAVRLDVPVRPSCLLLRGRAYWLP